MGSAGVALHPRQAQTERGGHHEGTLAEVRSQFLHQVREENCQTATAVYIATRYADPFRDGVVLPAIRKRKQARFQGGQAVTFGMLSMTKSEMFL